MIDAIDLVFTKDLMDRGIQFFGGSQICAERLLDDDPSMSVGVVRQSRSTQLRDGRFIKLRHGREVINAIGFCSLFDLSQSF